MFKKIKGFMKEFVNDFFKHSRAFHSRANSERGIWPALAFLANPAFWSGASNAAGAAGSIMSMFGGGKDKDTKSLEEMMPAWQSSAGQSLSDWAQKYLKEYQPGAEYTGQFTAGMAPGEESGQSWLMKFLNQQGPGENYGLAADELKKTMTGAYDPYKSDYYQALRSGAQMEMQDSIDAMRRGQGARGSFFQDTSIREEDRMRSQGTNALMQILGSLAETERGRRWEGVDKAMQLEQYKEGLPLAKAQAGMELGSLPRLIEQSDLEAKYKDFLRKQDELSQSVGATQSVLGANVNYGVKDWEQQSSGSPFERIMGLLGNQGFQDNISGLWSGLFGKKAA